VQQTGVTIGGAQIRRPATALLLGAMAISSALIIVLGSRLTFLLDDWGYILGRRDFSVDTFLKPANEHLVAAPIAIWKSLLAIFGMSSTAPFHVVSTAAVMLAVWLLFVWMRRRVGEWPALIATVPVLFMGAAFDDFLWFSASISFVGSLACGLGMLLSLDRRDEGGDLRACLWLIGSMLFNGLWLAFAVAAAVDIALRRNERPWRDRAYLVVLPLILFAIWWLGWGKEAEGSFSIEHIGTTPLFVLDSFAAAIGALLGLATPAPGVAAPSGLDWGRPLAVLLGALAVWRCYRLGRVPRSFWVVLAAGLAFWVLGGLLVKEGRAPWVSRYQLPGATFVLLAAAELLRGVRLDRRMLWPAIVVVAAASASGILFLDQAYRSYRGTSELERADLAALEIARDRVDPRLVLTEDIAGTGYVALEAAEYLSARDAFGSPAYSLTELSSAPEAARAQADTVLARALEISLTAAPPPERGTACRIATSGGGSVVADLPNGGTLLRAGAPAEIAVGRFSTSFPVQLGSIPAGSWRALRIPGDRAARPWRVSLSGPSAVRLCPLP
jgi:hypothetical protein